MSSQRRQKQAAAFQPTGWPGASVRDDHHDLGDVLAEDDVLADVADGLVGVGHARPVGQRPLVQGPEDFPFGAEAVKVEPKLKMESQGQVLACQVRYRAT